MRNWFAVAAVLGAALVAVAAGHDAVDEPEEKRWWSKRSDDLPGVAELCNTHPDLALCELAAVAQSTLVEVDALVRSVECVNVVDWHAAEAEAERNVEKRKSAFVRFGKRKSAFVRFGKRKSAFVRFGKRKSSYVRFG